MAASSGADFLFSVPASIAIGSVLEAAARLGEPIQQVQPEMVPRIIFQASQPDRPKRRLQDNPYFVLGCGVIGGLLGVFFFFH